MRRFPRLACASLFVACALLRHAHAVAAATAPNTTISNTSTASYQDANSNNYSAASNTVSVVVQNAPSMTVTGGTAQTIAPGQTVTDTFSIQNTGNASGQITLTTAGVVAGSDSGSITTTTYTLNGAGSYTSLSALQAALNLAGNAVPAQGTITIGVVYALATSATAPGDVQTNLAGTIYYAPVGSATAQTSASATASSNTDDLVKPEARLDLQLTSSQAVPSGVTYVLNAANGSAYWGAKDLTAVQDLPGIGASGVFISEKIPQFNAAPLTVSGSASVVTSSANGFATGATAAIYYSTSPTGASGWTAASSGVIPAGAYYIGVLIAGGHCGSNTNTEICPGGTSSPGNVASPAVTLTYAVAQPTGTGAGSTPFTTIGNSLIGSNSSTEYVIGPGITAYALADGSDTSSITSTTNTGAGLNNTVSEGGPSGASQVASYTAVGSYAVANGPFGNASATGAFDGSANDGTHDFTVVSFMKSGDSYTTTNAAASYTPTVAASSVTSGSVTGINVESTIANIGSTNDTYTIVATAPAGWTVQLMTDSSTTGVPGTPVSSLGGAGSGATSTASNVSINSGATLNYFAVYAAPSGVAYLSEHVGTVVATSNGSASAHDQTNHIIYAGFIAVTTSAAIVSGCRSGQTVGADGVCPTGTITYTVDYRNIVNTVDVSSVPAVSFAKVSTKAGTLVIDCDGTNATTATNNWSTFTNGPNAAPADTTPGTTFAYYTGTPPTTSAATYSGATKFTATIGGSSFQLVPAGYGSGTSFGDVTYTVTVK